jgi:NAD(P)-dependent dehydrogenase (short-subunit alcohol dehydrogenase family)
MTQLDTSLSLSGKVAAITGAASGIGSAIADLYASRGASIAVLDMLEDKAGEKAAQLGGGAAAFAVNVSDPHSVNDAVAKTESHFGHIDILVNSAGVVALAPAEAVTDSDWDRQISVNLTGTFNVSRAVGNVMLQAGSGKIINLASQAGSIALAHHAAYCASKWGVIGLTKVLASEWAGRGVTVNSISPTVVLTELGKKAWAGEKGEAMKKLIPTGRFALPEEIAAMALFLASPLSEMINGADIVIDGGYSIQ